MSATPRPWFKVEDGDGHTVITNNTKADRSNDLSIREWFYGTLSDEDADFIVRAVNAFDALLAVCRAAWSANDDNPAWLFEMSDALTALDTAHPGWRDWG